MAYKQKPSPFKQTALDNLRGGPFQNNAEGEPEFRDVRIGDRPKRSLKDAYDIALKKGYRKKSESFKDYSKRAKADPLYGRSGSTGFSVKALYGEGFDGEEYSYNDTFRGGFSGRKVKDIAEGEAKEYAAKTKKLNANASKIRKSRKLNEQALKNKPKVKEAKEVKLEPQKINTQIRTTKATATTKQATTTLKAPKKPRTSSDKTANRKYQKEMRAYNRKKPKTEKGTYNFAEGTGPNTSKFDKTKNAGDKPKRKIKARRRAAKGSTRATLRK